MELNELSELISKTEAQAEKMMKNLSIEDQKKVNKIVDGTDLSDLDAMSKEINNLNSK